MRGVSAAKEDVHNAIKNIDKGIFPQAFCKIIPDISANDSIDRLIYCRKTGGKSEDHRTFYPCWNWPKAELLRAIRESGLKLSSEYKYVRLTC